MSNLSNLIAAIDGLLADGEVYNAIVHGPATGVSSLVATDGGNVKTLSRVIAEFEDTSLTSILTSLAIPSYANLTAANAAMLPNELYFDTTLNKIQITTS